MSSAAQKYLWKEIPRSSHDLLRRRIESLPAGLRLLDLGAAGGELGRAVRGHCSYLAAVEPDGSAPAPGRAVYDDWRPVDALSAGSWPQPFDVVVCADVLEHLPEPHLLLGLISTWLRPRGVVLVSLPNVANVSVRLSLLSGNFRYAERGILDRTHLRFYTLETARELLTSAGFRIRGVDASAMPYELAVPWLGRPPWAPATRAFAATSAHLMPRLFGYQFLFEAEKG